jgi:hypothetical protein
MLISAAPKTVHVKADDGSLPLHVAMLYSRPIDLPVIRYLLLLHPEAAILPDGHGLSPKEILSDSLVELTTKLEIIGILDSTASQMSMYMLPECPQDERTHQGIPRTITLSLKSTDENIDGGCFIDNTPKIKQCVVCMDRDASRILVPCGHAGKSTKESTIFFNFNFC